MSTLPHSLSESAIQQIQQFRSTANQRTQERVFAEYLERRSHNTLRRHRDGLHRFAWFLLCAAHGIRLDYQDDAERFQPKPCCAAMDGRLSATGWSPSL